MKLKMMAQLALLVVGCLWAVHRPEAQTTPVKPISASALLSAPTDVAGYKKWKAVNAKPHFIPAPFAGLCDSSSRQPSSHPSTIGKYIRVFVNAKGQTAMFAKSPKFPVGSVVVKEKLPSEKSRKPELLTAMIKRAAGYDAKNGDWEYLVTDGQGRKAFNRGKLANCLACHVEQAKTDYVFRSYVPDSALRK